METFKFRIDQLSTVWEETRVEFQAESFEEAKKKAIEYVVSERHLHYLELDIETVECMPRKKNLGDPTQCISLCEINGEYEIWNNADPEDLRKMREQRNKAILFDDILNRARSFSL